MIAAKTVTHLLRAVERGKTTFVFSHAELAESFPGTRSADVGEMARALGDGWGVRDGMRHVLTFTGDRRDGIARLREMLS